MGLPPWRRGGPRRGRLRSQLYGVGPADAATYALALALLAAAALVSCWYPARRAVSADVLEVLHAE